MQEYLYNLATDKHRGAIAAFLKFFLFFLSFIYGLIIRLFAFISSIASQNAACKIASVGNITLGGTGKTVAVEYVAEFLKSKGRKVAILSRGYKKKATKSSLADAKHSPSEENTVTNEDMGDEPFMLKQRLDDIPVIVDADRLRAAAVAVSKYKCDTAILDDGFQQWRIKKDLDIVVVDSTNPFGNRNMIPRGLLREPLSALKRADVFLITKVNLDRGTAGIEFVLRKYNTRAIIAESAHWPVGLGIPGKSAFSYDTGILKGKSVALFSGIGDPRSFEALIENCGAKVALSFKFQDHYAYSKTDLENIINVSRNKNIGIIITTEKDAARLSAAQTGMFSSEGSLQFFYLRIELKITKNEEGFHARLLELCGL